MKLGDRTGYPTGRHRRGHFQVLLLFHLLLVPMLLDPAICPRGAKWFTILLEGW